MADGFYECPELIGKVIQSLRVYDSSGKGNEVVIEFTDGTAFSCSQEAKSIATAMLFRPSAGTPEVLRNYRS